MSFGWSAGDVVSSIKFIYDVCQALREEQGANGKFQYAINYLASLADILEKLKEPNVINLVNQKDIERVRASVVSFRNKIVARFGDTLGVDASGDWRRVWTKHIRKLQYAFFTLKEVETLQGQISYALDAVKLTLARENVQINQEVLNRLRDLQKVISQINDQEIEKTRELLRKVLSWLKPIPIIDTHHSVMRGMMEGSCEWLLKTPEYTRWRSAPLDSGEYPMLWLSGIPGAGKTRLATKTIEDMHSQTQVAWFYCDSSYEDRRSSAGILRTWTWQLLSQDKSRVSQIAAIYHDGASPNTTNMQRALKLLLETTTKTTIILDGLDECEALTQKEILEFLASVAGRARVALFSRQTAEISSHIHKFSKATLLLHLHVSEKDNGSDISRYIRQSVMALDIDDIWIRDNLIETLGQRANGMFLWAAMMVKRLSEEDFAIEDEYLDMLEHLPTDLYGYYDQQLIALAREDYKIPKAQLILDWMTCTNRPLTMIEIGTIIRTIPGQSELPKNGQMTRENVRKWLRAYCGPLVEVQERNGSETVATLIHASLREFLLGREKPGSIRVDAKQAHSRIAQTCLTYLCYNDVGFPNYHVHQNQTVPVASIEELKPPIEAFITFKDSYPLCGYAAVSWPSHLILSMLDPQDHRELMRLCGSEACTIRWMQILHRIGLDQGSWQDFASELISIEKLLCCNPVEYRDWLMRLKLTDSLGYNTWDHFVSCGAHRDFLTEVHVATLFDFADFLSRRVRDRTVNANCPTYAGHRLLHLAVEVCAVECVKLLLQHGADPNIQGGGGHVHGGNVPNHFPLFFTREFGPVDESIVRHRRGRKRFFWPLPLHFAARRGDVYVVRLLLAHGATVDGLPRDIVEMLIDSGTPLMQALSSWYVSYETVKALLDAGASTNVRRWDLRTPMHLAAQLPLRTAELLLGKNDSVDKISDDGSTPLHDAVMCDNTEVVRLLCKQGADLDAKDNDRLTPQDRASKYHKSSSLNVLLEHDSSRAVKLETGLSSFQHWPRSHRDIFEVA